MRRGPRASVAISERAAADEPGAPTSSSRDRAPLLELAEQAQDHLLGIDAVMEAVAPQLQGIAHDVPVAAEDIVATGPGRDASKSRSRPSSRRWARTSRPLGVERAIFRPSRQPAPGHRNRHSPPEAGHRQQTTCISRCNLRRRRPICVARGRAFVARRGGAEASKWGAAMALESPRRAVDRAVAVAMIVGGSHDRRYERTS